MMKYITLFLCELLIFLSPVLAVNPQIRNGADQLDILLPLLKNKRTGLVINQTSRCGTTPLPDALNTQVKLIRIFAPEHGFRGTADAGETIRDGKDIRTGLPIISLYGKNKKPLPEQLQESGCNGIRHSRCRSPFLHLYQYTLLCHASLCRTRKGSHCPGPPESL